MNPDERIERPTGTLVFAVVLAVTNAWLAIRMPDTIGSFESLFKGFGAELPLLTRLVIAIPYAWWIFAACSIALLAWVAARQRVTRTEWQRMKFALRALLVITALAFGLVMQAMYLPIFKLGEVV